MRDSTKQFYLEIFENGERIDDQALSDPFIRTTIRPRGLRAAWQVLFGKREWVVRVDGTRAAIRVVFDGDYTPPPPHVAPIRDSTADRVARRGR